EEQRNGERGDGTGKPGEADEHDGVSGEDVGDGGDWGGLYRYERSPTVEVSDERAVDALEIDILPAGFGNQRGDLGVGQRAEEREHSRHEPDEKQEFRRTHFAGHNARLAKDAGANHPAN